MSGRSGPAQSAARPLAPGVDGRNERPSPRAARWHHIPSLPSRLLAPRSPEFSPSRPCSLCGLARRQHSRGARRAARSPGHEMHGHQCTRRAVARSGRTRVIPGSCQGGSRAVAGRTCQHAGMPPRPRSPRAAQHLPRAPPRAATRPRTSPPARVTSPPRPPLAPPPPQLPRRLHPPSSDRPVLRRAARSARRRAATRKHTQLTELPTSTTTHHLAG